MIRATIRQNKVYQVVLPLLAIGTVRRFNRRFIGVNLRITGGEIPTGAPIVLVEVRTPPPSRK